jgi:hypothetical protein
MPRHCPELIAECCEKVKNLAGDAAEIGVYQGESATLICKLLPTTTLWMFDTLCGFPPEQLGKFDFVKPKDFSDTSLDIVADVMKPHTNYNLLIGTFPDTAKHLDVRLKFVHVDCDTEFCTQAALEWAWPKLVPGGILLDDDYISGCTGARVAVDRFCKAHKLTPYVRDGRAVLTKAEATR